MFSVKDLGNAASFLRMLPHQGCKHVCVRAHTGTRPSVVCDSGARFAARPGYRSFFGSASQPLSFSFFSSGTGVMITTHPTVGRFTRKKSGPPWPSPGTGHPRSPGAASVHCPVSVTVAIPLPYRLWSRRPGLAVPKPPPVGKGLGCWASSHSNLSFRTLSGPHNGPGDHSHPPSTPSFCTAGKWALPSTAGRGSSSAGALPRQAA